MTCPGEKSDIHQVISRHNFSSQSAMVIIYLTLGFTIKDIAKRLNISEQM
jgi:DNA-binding NarL/FixJ family response regulator